MPKRKPLHPSTNVRWGRRTSTVVRGQKSKKPGKRNYGPMMPR